MGIAARLEKDRIIGLILPTGALHRSALHLDSTGRRVLSRLLAEGVLRSRWNVVHLPDADPAVIAARCLRGLLTCTSALARYGLPDILPVGVPHVAVPANRGRMEPEGVVVHREPGLVVGGELFVPPERLLARLLRCGPEKETIAIVDSALNHHLVTREEIAALLTGKGNDCPRARRRLGRCTERARSSIESIARIELQDAGHLVESGVMVPGVGELDNFVDRILDLETDGFAYHSSYSAWMRDRQRDQALLARGLLPLRLTYDDVMAGRTVSLVEAALAGFGRRNGALGGSFGWAPAGLVVLSAESCGS